MFKFSIYLPFRVKLNFILIIFFLGTAGSLACNFEGASLCVGWTQDKNDTFDWTQKSGNTGSSNTGPQFDHTLGTSAGMHHNIFYSLCLAL